MSKPDVIVIDIIEAHLKANGFDGLFSCDGECACEIGDLAPCDGFQRDCEAGYRQPCPEGCGDHDWHMGATKPEGGAP